MHRRITLLTATALLALSIGCAGNSPQGGGGLDMPYMFDVRVENATGFVDTIPFTTDNVLAVAGFNLVDAPSGKGFNLNLRFKSSIGTTTSKLLILTVGPGAFTAGTRIAVDSSNSRVRIAYNGPGVDENKFYDGQSGAIVIDSVVGPSVFAHFEDLHVQYGDEAQFDLEGNFAVNTDLVVPDEDHSDGA